MNTIEYKYNHGQTLYFIGFESIPLKHRCPMCGGEGILIRKDQTTIECPKCNGKKEVEAGGSIKHKVYSGVVDSIKIFIKEGHLEIYYNLLVDEGHWKDYTEDKLFDDFDMALVECSKLGKRTIMGYTS